MIFTKLSLVGGFAFLGLISLAVSAASVAGGGMVVIQVHETGPDGDLDLTIPIPGIALEAGILAANIVLPDEARHELRDVRDQIGPWSDTLTHSLRQLDELPDATLVQVEDGDTLIEVAKENGHFVVQVDEPDTRVHIRLPTRSLRLASRFLTS